jgi:hypothetical protein
MRRALHFLIILLGVPIWCLAYFSMVLVILLTLLANKVLPNSDMGNCWSYVLPLWWERGGYLILRKTKGASFLWLFPVIHALHSRGLRDADVTHIKPVLRKTSRWLPLFTLYFTYTVHTKEEH